MYILVFLTPDMVQNLDTTLFELFWLTNLQTNGNHAPPPVDSTTVRRQRWKSEKQRTYICLRKGKTKVSYSKTFSLWNQMRHYSVWQEMYLDCMYLQSMVHEAVCSVCEKKNESSCLEGRGAVLQLPCFGHWDTYRPSEASSLPLEPDWARLM